MSGIDIPQGLLQRYYNIVSARNYSPKEMLELQELLASKLSQVIHYSIKELDKTLSIPNLLKAFLEKPDTIAKRSVYGELRKVVNLINTAIHRYGYVSVELFSRHQINEYIRLLQKAGFAVNEIREKVNIATLHKQIYGFMDSLEIKLGNPQLFATTSRVTVIESAEKDVRKEILRIFREKPTEIYNPVLRSRMVYPSTEGADFETNVNLVMHRLKLLGFGERINVSNNPAKPYWRSLDDYASTWVNDTMTRCQFLTTTHLCEASGLELVKWLADPDCCEQCASQDNKVFTLNPMNEEYEYLSIEPPVHPHCKCKIVPYSRAFDELHKDYLKYFDMTEPMTHSEIREQAEIVKKILKETA